MNNASEITHKSALNFDNFNSTSRAQWLAKIMRDLKIDSVDQFTKNVDGYFQITPFADATYLKENHIVPFALPKTEMPFLVAEHIDLQNIQLEKRNQSLLAALLRGVQTPVFFIDDDFNAQNFADTLFDVECGYIFMQFYLLHLTPENTQNFLQNLATAQKIYQRHQIKGSKNVFQGALNIPYTVFKNLTQTIKSSYQFDELLTPFEDMYFYCADAVEHTGETRDVVLQVAQLCLQLNTFFEIAEQRNLSMASMVQKMRLRVSVGTMYYTEIAKLRAIKIVVANLLKAWRLEPLLLPIDVVIYPLESENNTHQNKISATVQILAAYNGGASTVVTLSPKTDDAQMNALNTRILTNIQHVLQLESGIPQISDVAAGSYYIEQLTTQIAEAAWKIVLRS